MGCVWWDCTCGKFTEKGICHHALAIALEMEQGQAATRKEPARDDFKGEHMPAGVANADLYQKRGPGRPSIQQAIKDWIR